MNTRAAQKMVRRKSQRSVGGIKRNILSILKNSGININSKVAHVAPAWADRVLSESCSFLDQSSVIDAYLGALRDTVHQLSAEAKRSIEINPAPLCEEPLIVWLGRSAGDPYDSQIVERWHLKSPAITEKHDHEHGAASIYQKLGSIAYEKRDFQAAERWYRKSLAIAEAGYDEQGAATIYHQLGNVAHANCDFQAAERWYLKSLAIKQKQGNELGAAITHRELDRVAEVLPLADTVVIRIRMDRVFERFGADERNAFVGALQEVLGITESDLTNISFRKGSVIFEAEIPLSVWNKLKAMSESLGADSDAEELRPLKEFFRRFDVQDLAEQGVCAITVRATDKTKPDTRDHIIFIHGWSGTVESFGDLPKYIEAQLDCKVLVYCYPTRRLGAAPSVSFLAQNFDNWMRLNAPSARQLALVAHSMGGILARKFIADQCKPWQNEPLHKRVKQITLIASPYDGAVLARLAARFSNNVQLRDIDPNSPMILDMNREWEHWVRSNVPANCKVRCIVSADDSIVSVNNARGFDPNPIVMVGKTHSEIINPGTPDDEIVRTIVRLLREAGIGEKIDGAEACSA